MENKSQYEQVKEFHKTFNCLAPDQPTVLTTSQVMNRAAWIGEELVELLHGSSENGEEFEERFYGLMNLMRGTYDRQLKKKYGEDRLVAQSDAFLDIIYFANGGFVELGVNPNPLFDIVHNANMAKIWEDGLPHYNEVGKVIKPPNWVAPEVMLQEEIKHQINLARLDREIVGYLSDDRKQGLPRKAFETERN